MGLLRQVDNQVLAGPSNDERIAEIETLLVEGAAEAHRAKAVYEASFEQPRRSQVVPKESLAHLERWSSVAANLTLLQTQRAVLSVGELEQAIAINLEGDLLRSRPKVGYTLDAPGLMRLAITDLPVPDQTTPWQEIQAFKDEEDSKRRLRSLRSWLATTARGGVTLAEAADLIAEDLERYKAHIRGAGLRIQAGTLEALLKMGVVPSDVDVSAWYALQAKPFHLSQTTAVGRREEEAAPGRELSYLVKVDEAGL